MIWDLDTISDIERLYATAHISDEVLRPRRAEAVEATRLNAGRILAEMGHTFGVDICIDDVVIVESDYDVTRGLTEFTAGWRPATRTAEIAHHGQHDGTTVEVTTVGQPVTLAMDQGTPYIAFEAPATTTAAVPMAEFTLSGWNTTARRWVYSETRKSEGP